MSEQQLDRLVCFVYLLTRGTPHSAGIGWGEIKTVLREHLPPFGSKSVYTSPAGEALAREIVHELLTGEKPSGEEELSDGSLVREISVDDINRLFDGVSK